MPILTDSKNDIMDMRNCILLLYVSVLLFSCGGDDGGEEQTRIDSFSLVSNTFQEGDADANQEILVTINGNITEMITLSYRFEDDEAITAIDYTGSAGSIQVAPGTSQVAVPFTITGDDDFELTEELLMAISYESQETEFLVYINDDDAITGDIGRDDEGTITPEMYNSMRAVWSEEFNAAQLDTDTWNYELGDGCAQGICGWGNNELEVYTDLPENILLEDGKLVITATKDGDEFYSARITTQDKVEIRFGRIDIRARLPKGQGIWPAIWMLGANIDQVSWPACGEIDIMELVGHEPAKSHGTIHYEDNGYKTSTGSYTLPSGDFSDEFHVFSMVWDEDKILWYVDNKNFKSIQRTPNSGYPFNADFFFILNVAVGGNWPGNPDATTVFPQEMEVDYIRVFR